jgi:SAM-dependent methyltransferase
VSVWARIHAALYDPLTAGAERKELGSARRALLAGARGRVLEIGAGTGHNLPHYPPGIELVLTEPERHMARRLTRLAPVIVARAEELPFPDASFDTVVSTLTFCTVADLPAALAEVGRVLRPEGRLLFLEHVRGLPGSRLERWQDRLERPWGLGACGCHPNRDIAAEVRRAGFELEEPRRVEWPWMPALIRPVVIGSARHRPASIS